MMRSTFPDAYVTLEDVIAEDDKVVSRGTFTGTHRREFLGIPPTGKQVTFSVIHIEQLGDGKIVDHWVLGDSLLCCSSYAENLYSLHCNLFAD